MIHRGKDAWNRLCSMCDDVSVGKCRVLMADIAVEGKQEKFNEFFNREHSGIVDDFSFWKFINRDSDIRKALGLSRHGY